MSDPTEHPSQDAAEEDSAEAMDIHKPKAAHNWREFAVEIGTIICGIVIALGLEQGVEALRRQAEIRETRSALNAELGFDLAAFDLTLSQRTCMADRLDELSRWVASFATDRPILLAGPLPRQSSALFRTSVWRVASAGTVAQLPFEDRVRYGQLYDGFTNNGEQRGHILDRWEDLAKHLHARHLDEDQRQQLDYDIESIRLLDDVLASNADHLHGFADELGVKPIPLSDLPRRREQIAALCRPILPKAAHPGG